MKTVVVWKPGPGCIQKSNKLKLKKKGPPFENYQNVKNLVKLSILFFVIFFTPCAFLSFTQRFSQIKAGRDDYFVFFVAVIAIFCFFVRA